MAIEVKFLTMQELCIKLRISAATARRFLKDGRLQGMRLANREWRIVDPGPLFEKYLREQEEHLLHVPLLNIREVAAIIGCKLSAAYTLVRRGRLRPALREGKRRIYYFTVAEVRKLMQDRQLLCRPMRKHVRLGEMVMWYSQYLRDESETNRQNASSRLKDQVEKEVDKILRLPEPQRNQSLMELFRKLDKAKLLIDAHLKEQVVH